MFNRHHPLGQTLLILLGGAALFIVVAFFAALGSSRPGTFEGLKSGNATTTASARDIVLDCPNRVQSLSAGSVEKGFEVTEPYPEFAWIPTDDVVADLLNEFIFEDKKGDSKRVTGLCGLAWEAQVAKQSIDNKEAISKSVIDYLNEWAGGAGWANADLRGSFGIISPLNASDDAGLSGTRSWAKIAGDTMRIASLSYETTGQTELVPDDPLGLKALKCPCTISYKFFVSDVIPLDTLIK